MTGEEFRLTNGFSLFYDEEKVIPLLNALPTLLGTKIRQFIWNEAYNHSITDFKKTHIIYYYSILHPLGDK